MKQLTLLACLLLWSFNSLVAQTDNAQITIEGRRNSPTQQQKPYVILISADGFRYDYTQRYNCQNLLKLGQQGAQAEGMLPSFPSKTFPNHYTLLTGLYPAHHGLINNRFYDPQRKEYYTSSKASTVTDPSWYGGTPLWVLAEQNQMLSACFYWPGSEAAIKGTLPSYYYKYSEKVDTEKRIQTVVEWLQLPEDRRPHLITFYMPQVDHAGHTYGPDAPETAEAVRFIDESVQKLTEAVKATGLPVNFVFVADHGMAQVDQENPMRTPAIDTTQFVVSAGDIITELYAKDKDPELIKKTYKRLKKERSSGYKVYLKDNTPKHLHYRAKKDSLNRIGDIILVAQWPKVFQDTPPKPVPGHHGYDPKKVKDLQATFIAWGPGIKQNVQLPVFENVQVFPVIARLLGLEYTFKIDGDQKIADKVVVSTTGK